MRTPTAHRSTWITRRFLALGVCLALVVPSAKAQEQLPDQAQPATEAKEVEEQLDHAPAPKLTLDACIQLAFENQPALAAARASLAAAQSGQRGINSLRFAAIISHDIPIRREQACIGVQIAQAALFQAEWETRYAVTRNYYSVVYARRQTELVRGLVDKLDRAGDRAKLLLKAGDPNLKVTQIDVDSIVINRDFYKARTYEASVGIDRAFAALREAIGVKPEYPLDIIDDELPAIVENLNKNELIAVALTLRGEMAQVTGANRVTDLEITAQSRVRRPSVPTFAMGSDIHAKPIPQGVANGEYRPGAIGLEMPPSLVGKKRERMDRAADLNSRAVAVVVKTEGLIALEVEATYFKWREAVSRLEALQTTPDLAKKIATNVQGRFDNGNASGEELIRARTLEDQARANYTEALYNHALALAALERVTAGGFRMPHPAAAEPKAP